MSEIQFIKYSKKTCKKLITEKFTGLLAGAEGLEPSARGFGDRRSTN